ncbi:MAG: hypothetical protein Q7T18_04220 [Sedimentisphaerales bacterium]|nr:hypothetical protein [Sedimentisphaerales bacterium]
MENENGGRRFDDDIVRCKEEILRLKGRVPPFGQPPKRAVAAPVEIEPVPESVLPPVTEKNRMQQAPAYRRGDGAFSDTAAFSASTSGRDPFDTAVAFERRETAQTPTGTHTAESPKVDANESEVPDFDLAEQIMAEQRKMVGNRRKGPGSPRVDIKEEKSTPVNIPDQHAVVAMPSAPIRIVAAEAPMSPQQKVIADIVARDINKFYQTRNAG